MTVGLGIQAISRRLGRVGGSLVGAVGAATWSVVTYFMVPVVIYENEGAWPSLQRSAHLFISTFGRTFVSNLVVGLRVGAGIVGAVVLGIAGIYVLVPGAVVLRLVLLGVALTVGAIFALIGAAAERVLRAAHYGFATTGRSTRTSFRRRTGTLPPPRTGPRWPEARLPGRQSDEPPDLSARKLP